jgi:hypothetical protein
LRFLPFLTAGNVGDDRSAQAHEPILGTKAAQEVAEALVKDLASNSYARTGGDVPIAVEN